MTPTEPRTEAGRVLLRYLDRIWQMALDGEALSVYEDERHEDHQHDVAAILAIEAEALAAAESQREALSNREYGRIFGEIMRDHPKADARLVNGIMHRVIAALASPEEEKA